MNKMSSLTLAVALLCSYTAITQNETFINESGQSVERAPHPQLVEKSILTTRPILDYEPLREADITWEKHIWREIDTREKLNLGFRYPKEPLIEILSNEVLSGSIMAFADEEFADKLSISSVQQKLVSVDTVRMIEPISQIETTKVIRNELNPEDIIKYRIREIWYFDKETSRVNSRIVGIAPVREYYDDNTGAFKYEAPLFWISFKQAREALSGYTTFNPKNDASLLSWQDVLDLRMFSSYVYKESNVHDARLIDLYPEDGIARLMEGDRIESELYNWEHDLWTY